MFYTMAIILALSFFHPVSLYGMQPGEIVLETEEKAASFHKKHNFTFAPFFSITNDAQSMTLKKG